MLYQKLYESYAESCIPKMFGVYEWSLRRRSFVEYVCVTLIFLFSDSFDEDICLEASQLAIWILFWTATCLILRVGMPDEQEGEAVAMIEESPSGISQSLNWNYSCLQMFPNIKL